MRLSALNVAVLMYLIWVANASVRIAAKRGQKKTENNWQNLINNLTTLYLPLMGLTGIDGMIIVLCFRWGLSETCKTTDKTI